MDKIEVSCVFEVLKNSVEVPEGGVHCVVDWFFSGVIWKVVWDDAFAAVMFKSQQNLFRISKSSRYQR